MGGVDPLQEIRREAAWENQSGAEAAARRLVLAGPVDEAVALLAGELLRLEHVDLTDDAGDGADEVARLNAAIRAGLREAGEAAVQWLVLLVDGPPTWQRISALEVLAPYGRSEARAAADRWLAMDLDELTSRHIRQLMAP